MSEMVERVARALWEENTTRPRSWDLLHPIKRDALRLQASAVIGAMREPTEAMLAAASKTEGMQQVDSCIVVAHIHGGGLGAECTIPNSPLQQAWRAMIDAALVAP